MKRRRIVITAIGAFSLVALAIVMAAGAGLLRVTSSPAQAQGTGSDMQQRLEQVIEILRSNPGPEAASAAIDDGMEILYGGLRPLPSKDLPEQTTAAHQEIGKAELRFAKALEEYVEKGKSPEQKGRALDLKLLIEQMNEVARAVGEITAECGDGDMVDGEPNGSFNPCSELQPLLDELTGEEATPMPHPPATIQQVRVIRPGYSVKLRSPFVPRWFSSWEEDVLVTEPIGQGECAVVFKETRGLMLRLHFQRIIVVNDPWVGTFGLPRGTRVPIWTLEWVPSEYAKEWNICNAGPTDGTTTPTIVKTVTKRVVQDIPLKYFWRFYPKNR